MIYGTDRVELPTEKKVERLLKVNECENFSVFAKKIKGNVPQRDALFLQTIISIVVSDKRLDHANINSEAGLELLSDMYMELTFVRLILPPGLWWEVAEECGKETYVTYRDDLLSTALDVSKGMESNVLYRVIIKNLLSIERRLMLLKGLHGNIDNLILKSLEKYGKSIK